MKPFLPWLISITLAVLCLGLYVQVQHFKTIATATSNNSEVTGSAIAPSQSQPEINPQSQTQAESNELAELRNDHADLLRLRNEVRQLREQTNDLAKLKQQNTNLANQVATSTAQVRVMQHAAERTVQTSPAPSAAAGNPGPPKTGMTGMALQAVNNQIIIGRVIPNTPASKANVQEGSVLVAVDGVSVEGKNLAEVVQSIRGDEGTAITLDLLQGTPPTQVRHVLTREKLPVRQD
jgi:C-terminal processing protease CtpA/Prc